MLELNPKVRSHKNLKVYFELFFFLLLKHFHFFKTINFIFSAFNISANILLDLNQMSTTSTDPETSVSSTIYKNTNKVTRMTVNDLC